MIRLIKSPGAHLLSRLENKRKQLVHPHFLKFILETSSLAYKECHDSGFEKDMNGSKGGLRKFEIRDFWNHPHQYDQCFPKYSAHGAIAA